MLSFIKYSNDRDRLEETVLANEGFRHLERDAVDVLDACTNAKLAANQEDEEAVDVCQAIQEMMDEAAKEAAEKATEKATRESAERTTLGMIRNLMESMGLPKDKAMDALKIPESQRKALSSPL